MKTLILLLYYLYVYIYVYKQKYIIIHFINIYVLRPRRAKTFFAGSALFVLLTTTRLRIEHK